MNISSFLKTKDDVIFVYDTDSVTDAIEKIQNCRFTSIPVLNNSEEYVGTLTSGDLLSALYEVGKKIVSQLKVSDIARNRDYTSVNIDSNVLVLLSRAADENFVPIVNDAGKFIGIVTRKVLINYFLDHNFIVL